MKKFIIVLSVFLAVNTVASAQSNTKPSKEESQKTTYACPMHSDVIGMKEGKCDKCGMELVKTKKEKHNSAVKGSQASTVVVAKYVCKMDGTTSDKACKCPKCGKEMSKNEAPKAAYACPMHPKVTGKKGDNCSKCGMDLTKVGGEEKEENHKH
jgi:hypothetical protein